MNKEFSVYANIVSLAIHYLFNKEEILIFARIYINLHLRE